MVYAGLAFNTRGKLRKQTTNCGGIVLTFDIHIVGSRAHPALLAAPLASRFVRVLAFGSGEDFPLETSHTPLATSHTTLW